jgi:SHS2 domain-containing protein
MRVWAEDLPSLFVEAARGMNALSGLVLAGAPRVSRAFVHEGADEESLLVAFLSELIYLQEQEGLGFEAFELNLQAMHLHAQMHGTPIISVEKPIKAVTFHNLKIQHTANGCETEITFDV